MPINESAKDTKGDTIPPPHMLTNGLLMSTPADSNTVKHYHCRWDHYSRDALLGISVATDKNRDR